MRIINTEQLVKYITSNYDNLSTEAYLKIINTTMHLYPLDKPQDVVDAIDMIVHFSNVPLEIRPLFPDITTFDE